MIPPHFLNSLHMEEVLGVDGLPLKSRAGKQLYRLLTELSFFSAFLELVVTAPAGFITDLDSTPRIPVVYLLINGFGDMPAVVHDYLYSTAITPRIQADGVLREACIATGVPVWKANLIYAGVRVGGGRHFGA